MKIKGLAVIALTALLSVPVTAMAARKTEPAPTPEPTPEPTPRIEYSGEYEAFEDISEYVSERYIYNYSKDDIMKQGLSELLRNNDPLLVALLKSTLESLDDYSEFYTEEEYKGFTNQINHTFYGIGVVMREGDDGYVEVTEYVEGSDNAEKAGVKIGDKIAKVNGKSVKGQTLSEVREQVIGEEGTTVDLTLLRNGVEVQVTATRVAINSATVSNAILKGDIGYIQIMSFGIETASEFDKALDRMREKNVKKIILDLRNNGGGIVPSAVSIAQSIVPEGKIIDVKYRQPEYDVTYTSELKKKEFDFVVLVNEFTASASEILASAIQESGLGVLVGTGTFGKAVIQNTYPLKNGSVFKLTVGQYITRNGNEINKVGLTPDVYAENNIEHVDTSGMAQFDYNERTSLGQTGDNALAAKERLEILGYYKGDKDDVFDSKLFDSVKIFQRNNGIFAYGILDIPTQRLIDEFISEVEIADDKQLEAAYEQAGGDLSKLYNDEGEADD